MGPIAGKRITANGARESKGQRECDKDSDSNHEWEGGTAVGGLLFALRECSGERPGG